MYIYISSYIIISDASEVFLCTVKGKETLHLDHHGRVQLRWWELYSFMLISLYLLLQAAIKDNFVFIKKFKFAKEKMGGRRI